MLVDDKPRILSAVKNVWGPRVTTVLPRQGRYACDAGAVAEYGAGDLAVSRIGELLDIDLDELLAAGRSGATL